jgi:hypothetical protein
MGISKVLTKVSNDKFSNLMMGNWSKATGKGTQPVSSALYVGSRLATTALAATLYQAGKQPDAILGYVLPLYNIQYLEVGRSQQILQYRAIGAEFLAQQKGGLLGIRIDLLLTEPKLNDILLAVRSMYMYGRAEEGKYDKPVSKSNVGGMQVNQLNIPASNNVVLSSVVGFSSTIGNMVQPVQEDLLKPDNVTDYETSDDSWRNTVSHKTFPLITRDEIIFDCYIESIMINRSIAQGSKALKCVILIRQFKPDDYVSSAQYVNYWKNKVTAETNKDKGLDEITASDVKVRTQVTTKPILAKSGNKVIDFFTDKLKLPWFDLMLNGIYRASNVAYRALEGSILATKEGKMNPFNVSILKRKELIDWGIYSDMAKKANESLNVQPFLVKGF